MKVLLPLLVLCTALGGCASTGVTPSAQLARPNYAPAPYLRGSAQDPRFMGSARGGEGYIIH